MKNIPSLIDSADYRRLADDFDKRCSEFLAAVCAPTTTPRKGIDIEDLHDATLVGGFVLTVDLIALIEARGSNFLHPFFWPASLH